MAPKNPVKVENLPPSVLNAFKRTQWFETAKTIIQIILMSIFALGLLCFMVLLILAGVSQNILPDTEGVRALSNLFAEVANNAKAVGLFALGFFFREYLKAN